MSLPLLIIRILHSSILSVSGWTKLIDRADSRQALIVFRFPGRLAVPSRRLLPAAVSLLLVFNGTTWVGTKVISISVLNGVAPAAAACNTLAFGPATNLVVIDPGQPAPHTPISVAVGDFNSDAKQDLVVANSNDNQVAILLGDGIGGFSAMTHFSTGGGSGPKIVRVGDFNGDGKQDLVTANAVGNSVGTLLGDGAGNFGGPMFIPANAPTSLVVGEFNGDGNQDVAVPDFETSPNVNDAVDILLADGTGTFSFPASLILLATTADPSSVAVGDFNSDGKQDLVTGLTGNNTIAIMLGNGTGTFNGPTNFGVGELPNSLVVGDFNNDNKQDVAVANTLSNDISVLLGMGTGSFSAATNFAAGTGPISITVGDFNKDGKQDLVVANRNSSTISILLGNGAGSFDPAQNFLTGGASATSVAVGDFNSDGKQDLVVSNGSSENVSIMLNTCDGVPSQSFADVPMVYWAWNFIERLYAAGITSGCGINPLRYCPEGLATRAQMAVFLERGINGNSYIPPAVGASTGFSDVPTNYWAAPFIKQLAVEGITAGCGNGKYCPESPITRAQMAVFLVRTFSLP